MILGVGVDLVEIDRIKKTFNFNQKELIPHKLAERVLTACEVSELARRWQANPDRGVAFLASRFAAKEAFSKAMGCGIGEQLSFQDLTVIHLESGQPQFQFSTRIADWMQTQNAQAHLSISDEKNYATAFVVLEKNI